ncbi:MAG: dihydroneopterin aldolase [Anaerolineae bacterium]
MPDRIILRGAQFHGKHGVSPEERVVGGRVIVDVELEYDTTAAGASDNLADTINYSDVFKTVRTQVEDQNFNLLESLAHRIADTLLDRFPAMAVTVYVRKQPPPIKGIVESAGVEIRKSR